MQTSRTVDSQTSRLTRYTQRIEHIMGRSKTKSKSPFRPSNAKANRQGPKVSNIDMHIKHEHSFVILGKIVGLKVKQFVSMAFIGIKLRGGVEGKSETEGRTVEEQKGGRKTKSTIVLMRMRNLIKKTMREGFQFLKAYQPMPRIDNSKQIKVKKQDHSNNLLSINYKQIITALVRSLNQIKKDRTKSAMTQILQYALRKKRNLTSMQSTLINIIAWRKQLVWRKLKSNVQLIKLFIGKLQSLTSRYHSKRKQSLILTLLSCSASQNNKRRTERLEEIHSNAVISMFTSTLTSLFKVRMMWGFLKLTQCEQPPYRIYLTIPEDPHEDQIGLSPRQRRFPRECYRFKRLLEIFYTNEMTLYDEVFYALGENSNRVDYLYKGSRCLGRVLLRRGFEGVRWQSRMALRREEVKRSLEIMNKLIKHKRKQGLVSGFWSIHSRAATRPIPTSLPFIHGKCSHRLFFTLSKLHKNKLIDAYVQLKSSIYECCTPINRKSFSEKHSPLGIYDDVAQFLEDREEDFARLRNGYSKLKVLAGGRKQWERERANDKTSLQSSESARAINLIKVRLSKRFDE